MYYRSYTIIAIWHALSLDISIPHNIFLYERIKWNTCIIGLDISKPILCVKGLGS